MAIQAPSGLIPMAKPRNQWQSHEKRFQYEYESSKSHTGSASAPAGAAQKGEQHEQQTVDFEERDNRSLAQAPIRQMAFCGARVLRIDIGIGNAVETHRAVAGSHHAAHDEQDNPRSLGSSHTTETVCRHPHGTEGKRHREQRVAKANEMAEFEDFVEHEEKWLVVGG
jgi:hypothetical protein